jgi:hypothetical protein
MQKKLLRLQQIKIDIIKVLPRDSNAILIKDRMEIRYNLIICQEARPNALVFHG